MGIFDFFKKKNEHQNDQTQMSDINNDIILQREGYLELSEICNQKNKRSDFATFIENLKDYSGDEEYMTTLNYVIDYLNQDKTSFIICLDWKEEISWLSYQIDQLLQDNFDLKIDLPQQVDYGETASVSYENVFIDFDNTLKNEGLQLSFIDTNSDEYVIVVHKIEDLEAVKISINKIGYDCLEANSSKISV